MMRMTRTMNNEWEGVGVVAKVMIIMTMMTTIAMMNTFTKIRFFILPWFHPSNQGHKASPGRLSGVLETVPVSYAWHAAVPKGNSIVGERCPFCKTVLHKCTDVFISPICSSPCEIYNTNTPILETYLSDLTQNESFSQLLMLPSWPDLGPAVFNC